ncbi:MAG TPA: hypothetical protein VGL77_00365 [Armatimonadota bacterium]|jgi:hypothetical protein
MSLLKELFPELVAEIRALLHAEGSDELISSLETATVADKCRCGDDFCSSIRTAPKPNGPYGPGHHTMVLGPERGMINLDIVNGRIVYIEVIDRPDIHEMVHNRIH